jgi:hypothetical protein
MFHSVQHDIGFRRTSLKFIVMLTAGKHLVDVSLSFDESTSRCFTSFNMTTLFIEYSEIHEADGVLLTNGRI